MPDKKSAPTPEMWKNEERPSRLPTARKKTEVKKVITAVERNEMPPRLAPMPIPMLLQERESPSKTVAFRESGRRRGASFGMGRIPR